MSDVRAQSIVIVGAGLVGSLLAALLARRGQRVEVYESRSDMRQGHAAAGRSINLVLTRRGIRALERVGLDAGAMALTVPVTGRLMHAVDGELTFQPYGRDESECNYSISRAGLNEYLIEQAEKLGATFHFDARLIDADFESGRLTFRDDAKQQQTEVAAERLFGTDGAASATREALQKLDGFDQSMELLDHGYKELVIPAGPDGSFLIERRALHIWPRGELMLMALPNLDGSFTVTLYLPHRGDFGFDTLTTEESVNALFRRFFPDAIPLIPELAASFLANPTGVLGTVRSAPWHHLDRAMLLGDAAHAIVPFFGQGMNSGFEDCTVLAQLLDEAAGDDWSVVFSELDRRRKPNCDAIADMALENFVEMSERVGDAAFLLRKAVEHRLEQAMPRLYRSRYSMVMYSHIPFRVAFDAGRIQQTILDELCRDLATVDALDLERARALIDRRLTPFLDEHGVQLDY